MRDTEKAKEALTHVLWIGGAPDAGKTSVATALVKKYGLQSYNLDEHAEEHWLNHVSQNPSAFGHALMQLSLDERWLQPPEIQVQNVLRITEDDFVLVLSDLLAMPQEPPILVEGNLPPALIAPYLTSKHQAIWMVPSEAFYKVSFRRRGKDQAHNARIDPQQTRANHMARDLLLVAHVKQEAQTQELPLLEVDSAHPLADIVATVEAHFAPFLNRLERSISPLTDTERGST